MIDFIYDNKLLHLIFVTAIAVSIGYLVRKNAKHAPPPPKDKDGW
jgi:hypothetical protein